MYNFREHQSLNGCGWCMRPSLSRSFLYAVIKTFDWTGGPGSLDYSVLFAVRRAWFMGYAAPRNCTWKWLIGYFFLLVYTCGWLCTPSLPFWCHPAATWGSAPAPDRSLCGSWSGTLPHPPEIPTGCSTTGEISPAYWHTVASITLSGDSTGILTVIYEINETFSLRLYTFRRALG